MNTINVDRESTGRAVLDEALTRARQGAERWAALNLDQRAALLERVHATTAECATEWVRTSCAIKKIDPDGNYAGEEWTSGPYALLTGAAALAATLRNLARGVSPLANVRLRTGPAGRTRVPILPRTLLDRIILSGFRAEVWTVPGVTPAEATARAGADVAEAAAEHRSGGVGVVLGAGNITSIAPLDALDELVAHQRAVVLKLNPILDAMKLVLERALAPLIEIGAVQIVSGGAAEGAYLTTHPSVSHVHITGNAATFRAIQWGTGDEAVTRRANATPRISVPITGELGGVSPIVVVPGRWTVRDLRFQAEHVVTMRLHNAGHNCIAGQVLVVSADWPQREAFLREVHAAFERAPRRDTWYPGSGQRVDDAASRPDATRTTNGVIVTASTAEAEAWIQSTEMFAPVLGVVEIPGSGAEFLSRALARVNDAFAGTLGINILIDPATEAAIGREAFDTFVADLRYGTIAINTWTGVAFQAAAGVWGAFAGGEGEEPDNGVGFVHNALLIDRAECTVLRGTFREFPRALSGGEWSLLPKPPWFVSARSAAETGRRLTAMAARPGWWHVPGIILSAFRA